MPNTKPDDHYSALIVKKGIVKLRGWVISVY